MNFEGRGWEWEAVAEGGGGSEVGGARIVMMEHWYTDGILKMLTCKINFILTGKIRYWILKMLTCKI